MSELQKESWYVVHTYSGHETKSKQLSKRLLRQGNGRLHYTSSVPTEDVVETTKTGKEKIRQRKVYPSYVLVKMVITDESWYVVEIQKVLLDSLVQDLSQSA
ncbi:transcription termination/antitermination NusG family protein [Metaclostridioides mangenotii]|uniref:transcription termination/antitermination NusG family protein n=1 Tax=Metaclostridioides mangenotii TaxID=1540 RepID=UPI001FA6D53C|nr:transcription termination/antitermination NusG family protein [Clostridioides mangenotii]